MTTLLVHNATLLVSMDDHRREIPDGGLFISDGFIQKVGPPSQLQSTADDVLEIAIRGGASVLGRNDIGSLEASRYADFFAIKLDKLGYAGALHDPVAAVIFYTPVNADYTVVGGKFIVKDGYLKTADIQTLVQEQNIAAERLLTS